MKLPVHILEEEDNIPLPSENYLLDLPLEHEAKLHFLDVQISPNKVEKRVLFLIPNKEEHIELIETVHTVGSIGVLMTKEPTDTFVLFNLNINDRFQITSLETDENDILWAHGHFVIETFSPSEQELPDLMTSIYTNLTDHKEILEPSVFKALIGTNLLLRKMDILANFILEDKASRIKYLQELENLIRWEHVTLGLRLFLRKGRPQKTKKTKEIAQKTTAKPVELPLTLTERLQKASLPDNVRPSVDRELERLERCNKSSTEYSMLQDYLSWVADIPWNQHKIKDFELEELKTQLDISHHGLGDVKEYILEHFCIERIVGSSSGSVLCFNGPAGTGKTTIAKEIAKVSGRPLVRIALGGLSDEAEIRG